MIKKSVVLITIIIILIGIFLPIPKPSPNYSTLVLDHQEHLLRAFLNTDEQWHFPPQHPIPLPLKQAVIYYEDAYFAYHPGINPISIVKSFISNQRAKTIKRGGSTITMQLMRLLDPKKRSYVNKLLECLQAMKFELLYSKDSILALYLSYAPYGGNIVGAETAALKYFDKPIAQLSWAEAALLAVLPNAPSQISPIKNSDQLQKKRDFLLRKLCHESIIDQATLMNALKEPLPNKLYYFNTKAEHLSALCKRQYPNQSIIHTTLDSDIQLLAEKTLRHHIQTMTGLGLHHAAVLVADVKSGDVVAYVGSPNFFEASLFGEIDMVMAKRSTGSLLKPFLYALAIDEGLILPDTILFDIPSNFRGYKPSNFSKDFQGTVFAKDALTESLNVPAVRLLNKYGIDSFYSFLKQAHITSLFRSPSGYGLSLILGGAEANLFELTGLYRGLANKGLFTPLSYLKTEQSIPQKQTYPLISEGSAYLTLETLKNVKRPGSDYYWEFFNDNYPLAWKTGTSYGQKDGWAIGVSPEWVIGVWVGDVKGKANSNLTGSRFAGPLLFDIFNQLPKDLQSIWFDYPYYDLYPITLCSETGFTANTYCPISHDAPKPKHSHYLRRCPYHVNIPVSSSTGFEVCSECWTIGDVSKTTILDYPVDVTSFIAKRWLIKPFRPEHNPLCSAYHNTAQLSINYPQHNDTIWLPRDYDGTIQKLTLSASHKHPQKTLYWYINDTFIQTTKHYHTISKSLEAGTHYLLILDEDGHRESIQFNILLTQ